MVVDLLRPGPFALALGVIARGVLALLVCDLALFSQPVPAWIPAPAIAAVVFGEVLVTAGIGLFIPRIRNACASILSLWALIWVVARIIDALRHAAHIVAWESLAEASALFVGVFLLGTGWSDRAVRIARALFGASCVVFGIAHFAYAEFTADMIPHWLPAHLGLVYATGACHAAAGIAILIRRYDRLAATLEACMLGLFVAIVHVPSLWMAPAPRWAPSAPEQWTELLIALTLAGAAGTVADSLATRADRSRNR